jgi:hypothetical protein
VRGGVAQDPPSGAAIPRDRKQSGARRASPKAEAQYRRESLPPAQREAQRKELRGLGH